MIRSFLYLTFFKRYIYVPFNSNIKDNNKIIDLCKKLKNKLKYVLKLTLIFSQKCFFSKGEKE